MMFILVNSNDLDHEGIVFNTEFITRIDYMATAVKIKLVDGSVIPISKDEYKRLNKNVLKVTKMSEI